jgi:hypothetical protein
MRLILIAILQLTFVSVFSQAAMKTENIILITLDGLRWQELFKGADSSLISDKQYVQNPESLGQMFWRSTNEARRETLMPFFWSTIQSQGQLYGFRDKGSMVNCSNQKWFSYPGYSEILCGFADHDRINSNDKLDNPNTTVLEFINNQQAFNGSVAAFGSWDVFPYIINEKRSKIPVNAGFESNTESDISDKEHFLNTLQKEIPSPWSTVRHDAFTHHYAMEYIKRKHPRLVYIAYGETDDFAHGGHYDAYLKSAYQTDAFISEIWGYAQNHPQYQGKTTMIITTDHGRGTVPKDTWRSHGIKISGADQIWIAVIGPDTPALGIVKDSQQYYQNQVAATVAKFLGLDYTNDRPVGQAVKTAFK